MDEQTVRMLLRLTARISCALFIVAFAGRFATHFASPLDQRLASFRTKAFFALATSHTFHLAAIVIGLIVTSGRLVRAPWLIGIPVGLGFLCIYLLPFLSARPLRDKASRVIERVAVYYVWTIFFLAMAGGAFRSPWRALTAVVLLALFILNNAARSRIAPAESIVLRDAKAHSQAS